MVINILKELTNKILKMMYLTPKSVFLFIKDNTSDLLMLIGISFISVGFFIWSTIIGFIVTGILIVGVSLLIHKGGV
ncbi:hypothetical protein HHA03_20380 [Halolactibacillus halophilus]|uniref:Uncharacterized protein n=1 Tax=Halolactibacillus halophilus TaxID=306540 RepID=A0ABQ0VN14_9BACI|nr:hypothetical protein HHA03_20380 [Halolactibacillus halophilus]